MAAIVTTKTRTTTVDATINATAIAAAGNAQSASFTPGTKIGYAYVVKFLNGGTGPTVGCTAKLQQTLDSGSTWVDVPGLARQQTNLTASTASSVIIPVPDTQAFPTRLDVRGNTGQTVTVTVWTQEVTNLSSV